MNILEILKTKPLGTKLWSPSYGDVRLNNIDEDDAHPICIKFYNPDMDEYEKEWLTVEGKLENFPNAECILFPSKQMRAWDKFSFAKDDVLHVGGDKYIIFERYDDNGTYSRVRGKYRYDKSDNEVVRDVIVHTSKCCAVDAINASLVRASIEQHYGGKLNPDTLKIERTSEFQDGDMVYIKTNNDYEHVAVFKEFNCDDKLSIYAGFCTGHGKERLSFTECEIACKRKDFDEMRLATMEERYKLSSKLAKIGLQWNPDAKKLCQIKLKSKFKPFDKVLGRNYNYSRWEAALFAEKIGAGFLTVGGNCYKKCIPYEGNEHLLGTSDNQ